MPAVRLHPIFVLILMLSIGLAGASCTRRDETPAAVAPVAQSKEVTKATAEPVAEPDYLRAVYDPLHFKPAIDSATDKQCLACHAEVLAPTVRETSPAGVAANSVKAWYQQTSTYQGAQDTFHRRHLETPMARQLMNLSCNTCHQGHDPREEAPGSSASSGGQDHTLRKQVNPETTCLKCHGQMNWPVMGLPEPWPKSGKAFQDNCLLCHAAIRTTRHQVTYLKADAIEEAAKKDPQVCYGCHGGRAWYRINYPYPRHAWSGMSEETPDWAKGRPQQSESRFIKPAGTQAAK